MMLRTAVLALALGTAAPASLAASVGCPDPSQAVRAGICPTEEELLFTFNGYCSDNARIYGKGAEVCTSYQAYRRMKNIVLWESRDGEFQAYVSCDLPEERLKAMQPKGISTSKDKGINRLTCTYDDGVVFTRRTHDACRIESAEACKHMPSACRADCGTK